MQMFESRRPRLRVLANFDSGMQRFESRRPKVAAIDQSKRCRGHFECKAHDPDRLRVELVATTE
jgi:hypothetical protein